MEFTGTTLFSAGQNTLLRTLLLQPSRSHFIDLIGPLSVALYFLFPIPSPFFILLVFPSFPADSLPDYLRFHGLSIRFDLTEQQ
jgi:hypothetical protein